MGGGGVSRDPRGSARRAPGGDGSGRHPAQRPRPVTGKAPSASELELSGNTRYRGVLEGVGIPARFGATLIQQLEQAGMDGIPVEITLIHGEQTPVAGAELVVRWDGGALAHTTNERGMARVTVTSAMARELVVEFPRELDARFWSSVQINSGTGEGPPPDADGGDAGSGDGDEFDV